MKKKFFLTAALPLLLIGCTQEELVSDKMASAKIDAPVVDGLTINVTKSGYDADTRALYDPEAGTASFESTDKFSLYWLGLDGIEIQNNKGAFGGSNVEKALSPSGYLKGKSNAVFREDVGGNFTSESVVYEGYNVLVFPADLTHVTDDTIKVAVKDQKANEKAADKMVWVSDSVLQIHTPAYSADENKYYNMYGEEQAPNSRNTAGYNNGLQVPVKQITSLLRLKLKVVDAGDEPVEIQKIVLTQKGTGDTDEKIYQTEGFFVPEFKDRTMFKIAGSKVRYPQVWFKGTDEGRTNEIEVDCSGINTVQENEEGTTSVDLVLLPAYCAMGNTNLKEYYKDNLQPVLKIYTNYGVVTVGGEVADSDAQIPCIYNKENTDWAAATDNEALSTIVANTNNVTEIKDAAGTVVYKRKAGMRMTRTVRINMLKAVFEPYPVNNTDELNTLLKLAMRKGQYTKENKLTVKLNYNGDGEFTLTNYDGLDAFVAKYGAGCLSLVSGTCNVEGGEASELTTIVANMETGATELKAVEGLGADVEISIPNTSAVTEIASEISNTVINKKDGLTVKDGAKVNLKNSAEITLAGGNVTLKNNKNGLVTLTDEVKALTVTALTTETYGTVEYYATTSGNLKKAAQNGANYITVENLENITFFDGGIDLTDRENQPAVEKGGITLVMKNCGDLNKTVSKGTSQLKASTLIMKGSTSYPDLTNAALDNVIMETASETIEFGTSNDQENKKVITSVTVSEGVTANIGKTTINKLLVKGTANLNSDADAPTCFYTYGTSTFKGKGGDVQNGKCIVVGTLKLTNEISYPKVAISDKPTVDGAVLTCTEELWLYSVDQFANAQNVANLNVTAITAADINAWSPKYGDEPLTGNW